MSTASPQQIEAKRLNAQMSTGPRSPEGKQVSSHNAVKHGLSGPGGLLPAAEQEEAARRRAAWRAELGPVGPYEGFLVELAASESFRVERCQRQEWALVERQACRAELCWNDDRNRAVEEQAAGLARRPSLVSRRLESTKQGCDWLIGRWDVLGHLLESGAGWDDSQCGLALDLMGFPAELRDAPNPVDSAADGNLAAARRVVVASELARLAHLKENALDELDAMEREIATRGHSEPDRAVKLIHRYEAAALRRVQWALAEFRKVRNHPGAASQPPSYVLDDAPEPEFDLPPAPPDPPKPPPAAPVAPSSTSKGDVGAIETLPVSIGVAPAPAAVLEDRRGNRRWRREQDRAARREQHQDH